MDGSRPDDHRLMRDWFVRRIRKRLRTLNSQQAYTLWAASYEPDAHNPLMAAEQAAMLALLPDVAGRTVLDLACGTGRYGYHLQDRAAKSVIGFDNSLAMLRKAQVPVADAAMQYLPLARASVDGVICALAIGHVPDIVPVFAEIGRVLKPGGWLLCSDLNPIQHYRGAQRSFRASDGKHYAVEHYPHLISDVIAAGADAGLALNDLVEPRLQPDDAPVVVVYKLQKY